MRIGVHLLSSMGMICFSPLLLLADLMGESSVNGLSTFAPGREESGPHQAGFLLRLVLPNTRKTLCFSVKLHSGRPFSHWPKRTLSPDGL